MEDIGSAVGMKSYRDKCEKVGSGGHICLYPVPASTIRWRFSPGLWSCESYVCVRLSSDVRLHVWALGLRPSVLGYG